LHSAKNNIKQTF